MMWANWSCWFILRDCLRAFCRCRKLVWRKRFTAAKAATPASSNFGSKVSAGLKDDTVFVKWVAPFIIRPFCLWLSNTTHPGRHEVWVLQAPARDVKETWITEIKRVLLNQFHQLKGQTIAQTSRTGPTLSSIGSGTVVAPAGGVQKAIQHSSSTSNGASHPLSPYGPKYAINTVLKLIIFSFFGGAGRIILTVISSDPCARRLLARPGNTITARPEAVAAAVASAALAIVVRLLTRAPRVRRREHRLEAGCSARPLSTKMTDGAPISPLAMRTWAKPISITLRWVFFLPASNVMIIHVGFIFAIALVATATPLRRAGRLRPSGTDRGRPPGRRYRRSCSRGMRRMVVRPPVIRLVLFCISFLNRNCIYLTFNLSGQLLVARRMGAVGVSGDGPSTDHQITLQLRYSFAIGQQSRQRTRSSTIKGENPKWKWKPLAALLSLQFKLANSFVSFFLVCCTYYVYTVADFFFLFCQFFSARCVYF